MFIVSKNDLGWNRARGSPVVGVMAAVEAALEIPSGVELLHVPEEITGRSRLATLIKTSLITEFPVNRLSSEAQLLTPDEGNAYFILRYAYLIIRDVYLILISK